jgi:phosphoribosylformylglycinamidine cyclo-ligase
VAAKSKGLTYASSGVDTAQQKAAIQALTASVSFKRTGRGAPLGGAGHFAGLVDFDKDTALALCTDGVGTKLEIAAALNKWDTVGIDCIAMNVNDCICVGAEPLAFVDYVATDKPDADVAAALGKGLNEGARRANVTLAGGETAILPELVRGLDLAGTAMGWVKKADIVDGSKVKPGDVLLGLDSSGLHSNGYTLARRILKDNGISYDEAFQGQKRTRLGLALLEPTHIYVREVLKLLRTCDVHGLANITGGGLKNVPRINPKVRYEITDPMPVPPLFEWLQALGGVEDAEMFKTFNMGMGFLAVIPAGDVTSAKKVLRRFSPQVVGQVTKGKGCRLEPFDLTFESKT